MNRGTVGCVPGSIFAEHRTGAQIAIATQKGFFGPKSKDPLEIIYCFYVAKK